MATKNTRHSTPSKSTKDSHATKAPAKPRATPEQVESAARAKERREGQAERDQNAVEQAASEAGMNRPGTPPNSAL